MAEEATKEEEPKVRRPQPRVASCSRILVLLRARKLTTAAFFSLSLSSPHLSRDLREKNLTPTPPGCANSDLRTRLYFRGNWFQRVQRERGVRLERRFVWVRRRRGCRQPRGGVPGRVQARRPAGESAGVHGRGKRGGQARERRAELRRAGRQELAAALFQAAG